MKTQLCVSGAFSRQVSLEPIVALPGHFCLQFESTLGTAKDPKAVKRNFEVILCHSDVLALKDLLSLVSAGEISDQENRRATK